MKRHLSMECLFEAPSWSRVYKMVLRLADKIGMSGFQPDTILAVSRGGWIPARVLCDLLSMNSLADIGVESYLGIGEASEEPTLKHPASISLRDRRVLIVDEVADTGKTMRLVKVHVADHGAREAKTAVIYSKPHSIVKPDFFEKETSSWIIFPWELKETIRKIIKDSAARRQPARKHLSKLVRAGVSNALLERFVKDILEEEKC